MGATTMLVLSAMLLLLAEQRARAASDAGFSVEFIHHDSPRSPFHDPALYPHGRMLAAAHRSLHGQAPAPAVDGGVES